jgi:hypothetical protein
MSRVVSIPTLALALIFSSSARLSAQQGTGELRGKVVDAQAAVLPGVTVVARNEASGMFREVVSSDDGSFFMSALTPGSYEVTAQLSGFKKYQRGGVRVEVGKTQSIDIRLDVGGIEQEVTVTAESPLVDTTTKQLGGSVSTQELTDVPSINRNFTSYLSLLPGVTATISTDSFGADSIRVNGQDVRNVNYTFDGAGNNDSFNNGNGGAQARVPVEAVQEFQLLTSQFDAEFGSSSGGVVNAVSKQGTNVFHGTGFFFDQNQAMTKRDYFAERQDLPKPETRQLQWGGNFGGPIVKDKLHYFVNLERIDQNRGRTLNIVARPELTTTTFTHDNVWNWMWRVDHQINGNNTWAVRWLRESSPQTSQFPSTNWTLARSEQENDVDWTMVGTLNSVIRNTKVNVLKISYTHEDVFFGNTPFFANGQNQSALGPTLVHQTFEDGPSSRADRRQDPGYQLDETFSWFVPGKRGDHDFKFGASYYYLPLNVYNADNLNGTFTFSASDRDFNASDPRTYPDRLSIRVPIASDITVRARELGFFAQDKWKATSRLTASLGLRYDVEIVPIDQTGNYLFSNPSDYPIDRNNVSPRLGATFALDDSSVIRGGWGLYYQKTPFSFFTTLLSAGAYSNSFTAILCGPASNPICPSGTSVDPGPSAGRLPTSPFLVNGPLVNLALLNQLFPAGSTQKNTGTVNFDNPDRHLPYSYQTSIGYERQLAGSMAFSADYIHQNLRDLYMRLDLNQGVRASTARTATLNRIDAANFSAAVLELVNTGWADYDALQVSLQKRFSRGYQFRVSYTRSRGFGNTASPGNVETIATATADPVTRVITQNLAANEGLTTQDRPNILSIDGSVLVPKTKGLMVSGVLQYQSGTPFTLTDSTTDANRNGNFEEPLPAGSYSGAASNTDAMTVENAGGMRGARGPDFLIASMRFGYQFNVSRGRQLRAYLDVFNIANRANYNNPSADRRDAATFLILRSIRDGGPTRTAQINVRYSF